MLPIITFAMGFVSGIYILSQIEKGIKTNIERNQLTKNLDNLDKNIDNDEPIVEHDGMRYNPETLEFKEMDKNIKKDD
tara:strand:- start:556 stop:789 length:234 start_codon:yes stop_codon:yes gene_type:complete